MVLEKPKHVAVATGVTILSLALSDLKALGNRYISMLEGQQNDRLDRGEQARRDERAWDLAVLGVTLDANREVAATLSQLGPRIDRLEGRVLATHTQPPPVVVLSSSPPSGVDGPHQGTPDPHRLEPLAAVSLAFSSSSAKYRECVEHVLASRQQHHRSLAEVLTGLFSHEPKPDLRSEVETQCGGLDDAASHRRLLDEIVRLADDVPIPREAGPSRAVSPAAPAIDLANRAD